MTRILATTTGAALFTLVAQGAAKADIPALPAPDAIFPTGWCDANVATDACEGRDVKSVVYTAFTVSTQTTITGFTYYSVFKDATYTGTNWSIWTGATSPTEIASGSKNMDPSDPPQSITNVGINGLELVTVSLDRANYITIDPNTQYWVGLQNNITTTASDGKSVYGSLNSDSPYDGTKLLDGTTYVSSSSAWTLPSISGTWGFQNAALSIQTTSVPEPSTWALMLAGFAALAWGGRRRLARQAV